MLTGREKFSACLMSAAVFSLLVPALAGAEGAVCKDRESSRNRLIEIPVADYVDLGDNQPVWETTVNIHPCQLRPATYAAVEFVGVNVWEGTSSNLVVNGRSYALPISEPLNVSDIPLRGKSVITIPPGALKPGPNSIRVESGPINNPTNLYDDFVLADIVLVVSR
jgi:hypothetical protein